MAQYLPLPDGSFVTIRENETPLQAYERATKEYPDAFGITPPAPQEGVGAAFRGGLEGLLSRARTGVEAIFDPEEAARRGLERGEDIGQRFAPGASLQRVKDVYAERGLLPAAGEAISQIPSALAEQAPNIAATLASGRAGAVAGGRAGGARGALVGGVGGALAPSLLQLFGSNIERQAEAQAESGQPLDISRGAALAAAAPGAALEAAATFIPLGRTVVGKILGPKAEAALATGSKNNAKLVEAGLLRTLGTGTVVGAGLEVPTEVIQQMLERAQAGLDLTSDDALAEYGEAAYGAALVGGPFGAAGRIGQRSVAQGEIEQEQAQVRAEDAKKAAEEDRLAQEAEEAEKATSGYRLKINAQLVEKKDRLRELEQLLKDKTTDEDVKDEAKTEAKQLRKELGDLNKQMKESMTKAGIAPIVESALKRQKTQIEQQQTIVDDFGNVISADTALDVPLFDKQGRPVTRRTKDGKDVLKTVKGTLPEDLTPEEEVEGYERQATKTFKYFAEREEALDNLRAAEEREDTARRIVEQELTQNQPFIRSGGTIPFIPYPSRAESFDPTQARKPSSVSQDVYDAATLDEKAEMLKQDRIDKYIALLEDPKAAKDIEDAQLDTERQKLNLLLMDEATKDQTAEEIARRKARDEAIVDIAELQVTKAREQLGLGALFLGPVRQRRVEKGVNEGKVDRYVASALEIRGLEGRTRDVAQAMPNIQKAIDTLESERRSLTGKDIINPDGGLTNDGIRLVQIDTKLEEIQRLLTAGAPEQLTATEQAIAGRTAVAGDAQAEPQYDPSLQKSPAAALAAKAEKVDRDSLSGFLDLLSFLDDSRLIREIKNKKEFGKMPVTPFENKRDIKKARKQVVDNIVESVAIKRAAQKLKPLTPAEAKKLAAAVDGRLNELITRSQALPSGYFLKDEIIQPAQMRGTEIVKSAEVRRIDPRDLEERQFAAPEQAVKVIAEEIMQIRDTGQTYTLNPKTKKLELVEVIPSGKRAIRAERPVLRQQFKTQPTESQIAQGERVVNAIEQVLAGEVDADMAAVLNQAADIIANRQANPTFLNTVDEQLYRIQTGIDKATKDAALFKEIKQDMDNKVAVSAAAMQDITTQAQGDMFAEDLATIRATPGMFRRLQKSRKVVKQRERIATEKAETAQTQRAALQAKREVDFEFSDEGIKQKQQEILDRIKTLAAQIQDNEGYSEVTVKNFKYKWVRSKDPDAIAAYKKEQARYDKTKPEDRTRLRVPFPPGSWEIVGPSTGRYTKRVATMSDRVAAQWAALDEDIKKEVANLRELERKVRAIKEKSEQRKAAARAATQQRQLVSKVKQGQAKLLQDQKQVETDLFKTLERAQAGLGLSGARFERKTPEEIAKDIAEARAERKAAIKAAGAKTKEQKAAIPLKLKSRFKIAAIKSAEDIAAERREIESDSFNRTLSPKDVQIKVQEQFDKALENRDKATKELDDFRKLVNKAKGAKDFAKYEKEFFTKLKELSAVVNVAQANYISARDNLNLLQKVDYDPNVVKRQTAPRTIAGPRTEAQKRYTPEQLAMLTGMPANMMPRITTIDDGTIDFRIGDSKPETPVDFAEAEKRLKEIKEKFDKMMSGEIAPKKPEVDLTRRRLVQAAGVALATPKMPASIVKAFNVAELTPDAVWKAVTSGSDWFDSIVDVQSLEKLSKGINTTKLINLKGSALYDAMERIAGKEAALFIDSLEYADPIDVYLDDFIEANKNDPQILSKIKRGYDVAATDVFTAITKDLKSADGKAEQVDKKETAALTPAKKTPTLNFYPSVADVPADITNAIARQDFDPLTDSIKGGVLPNGDVFIIIDAHSSMLDLEQTVAHELTGHYSFESMLGKDGMENLMRKVDKSFATKENQNGLENLADSLGLRDQYNAAVAGAYNFYKTRLEKGELTEKDVLRLAKTDGLREIIAYHDGEAG
jgi:hypothetical protein